MESSSHERGREAKKPHEIPKKGWKDILLRTKEQISEDNIGIVAAGMAFYALLAVPFFLTAMVALYGLVAYPADRHFAVSTPLTSSQARKGTSPKAAPKPTIVA